MLRQHSIEIVLGVSVYIKITRYSFSVLANNYKNKQPAYLESCFLYVYGGVAHPRNFYNLD